MNPETNDSPQNEENEDPQTTAVAFASLDLLFREIAGRHTSALLCVMRPTNSMEDDASNYNVKHSGNYFEVISLGRVAVLKLESDLINKNMEMALAEVLQRVRELEGE